MSQDPIPSPPAQSNHGKGKPARPPAGKAILRHAVDYMPLLLTLILALCTFWLVRSMPEIRQPDPELPANAPDYYLHDFQLRRYHAQGHLQDELTGQYGEHFPGPDTIHVRQAGMQTVDAQGNRTHGRANRAVADLQSRDIELFEQVHVVHQPASAAQGATPPAVTFESEYLQSTDRQEHIRTDKPVKITRANDVITGSGMVYTNSTRTVEVQGRAKAVIQPAP